MKQKKNSGGTPEEITNNNFGGRELNLRMIFSRFFKHIKPNKFEYQPRYFDQEREEIRQRFHSIRSRMAVVDETEMERLAKLSREFEVIRTKSYTYRQKQVSKSRFRFILILFVLSYLCYWFLTKA